MRFSMFKKESLCTEACFWLNSPSQFDAMFHLKAYQHSKQQSLTEDISLKNDIKKS